MQSQQQGTIYNGVIEAISTLLGAGAAFSVQFLHLNWSVLGELVLGGITALDAVLLVLISQTPYIAVAYVLYVVFNVLYHFLITVATFNVANNLEAASFGLVFGWNTFVALILQTILTFSVADERGFSLDIRPQFVVYGSYHGVIAAVFLIMGIFTVWKTGWKEAFALRTCDSQNAITSNTEKTAEAARSSAQPDINLSPIGSGSVHD